MNQLIFTRKSIYKLRQRYGRAAYLFHVTSTTENVETVTAVVHKIKYLIRKVILLPISLVREMNIIGEYKRIARGFPNSEIDIDTRLILIDKRLLPHGVTIEEKTDYIDIDDDRYQIQKMEEMEDTSCILITARYMRGNSVDEVSDLILNPTTLPVAIINQPYAAQLVVEGGTPQYSYTLLAGPLPPGIILDTVMGTLSDPVGPTTLLNPYTFTIQATDSDANVGQQSYTMNYT
jgi:hypothetical protein